MSLTLATLQLTHPTAQVPTGSLYLSVDGAKGSGLFVSILVIEIPGLTAGPQLMAVPAAGNTKAYAASGIAAGTYSYEVADLGSTHFPSLTGQFTVNPGPPPVPPDPTVNDPARWEPVGGVLPNPVLLQVEAALTDAAGVARPGLHVEVELWQPAAGGPFARFRATVRQSPQAVDAAPYLRAQLTAAQRYPGTVGPITDGNAALRFYYRFRVVDSTGPEYWQERVGERWAVLAALPGATDILLPYVADGGGRVASIFPSGEAVQFVGCPLEVSVLLPPATTTRYVEWRYLDAAGQQVQIRASPLGPTVPAGMLRLPLPSNPPAGAATVEVSITDTDRSTGTITPPAAGGAILTNTGHLLR